MKNEQLVQAILGLDDRLVEANEAYENRPTEENRAKRDTIEESLVFVVKEVLRGQSKTK